MEKESIFLTTREAVQAVIADFRQYPPQLILFSGIIGLITDNRIRLKLVPGKEGAWINRPERPHMKWLNGPETVNVMCDRMLDTPWNPDLLAQVCSRVFQARAAPETEADTGKTGVRILTHMEDFNCRQCGFCCRFLEYQDEVTAEDVALWKAAGRKDILKWVKEIRLADQGPRFRAWIDPVTGKPADTCPFLRKEIQSGRWHCRIHRVKPAICRQFPLNRKHAAMSGCEGFKKET